MIEEQWLPPNRNARLWPKTGQIGTEVDKTVMYKVKMIVKSPRVSNSVHIWVNMSVNLTVLQTSYLQVKVCPEMCHCCQYRSNCSGEFKAGPQVAIIEATGKLRFISNLYSSDCVCMSHSEMH